MSHECIECGASLASRRGNARFCGDRCRKRHRRMTEMRGHIPDSGPVSTADLVRAQLSAAGKADSYLAAAALRLAERIDQSEAVMGFAALVKELRATMAEVLENAGSRGDALDELKVRRDRKRTC